MIHPFQTDPGTSQGQRVLDELLSGKAKIDNRSLADLLNFFVQLSRHVNYYDENLQVSDWQPFFAKSLPFVLASIVKYDRTEAQQKLDSYKRRFNSKPTAGGLYLLLRYTYTNIIKKINNWDLQVANSGIPIETVMEKLMKDKLSGPLKNFIKYSNAATHWYGVTAIRFNTLLNNPAWILEQGDLYKEDDTFRKEGNTKRKRLIALYNKVFQLVQTFHDVIRLLSVSAEQSLDQSLLPLKEELKEKNPPHLAILFAFIKLFQYLQGDLNGYSKKHLDFFYKQVLQLKPKGAVPDKVHLVLDIQQQLDKYLFKKGLLFKDGKDNNKAEIYFASDDEIVVNKAQVVDQRTLFLNNLPVKQQKPGIIPIVCENKSMVEGVYMAPDATKANGIDKEFKDTLPSRATLGNKWSKYVDPENKFIQPYPNARLGFILASPVLLLNEGTRTITISLSCEVQKDYCDSLVAKADVNNPCCDNPPPTPDNSVSKKINNCLSFIPSADIDFANKVNTALSNTYYYISQPLIAALVKKGISKELKKKLQDYLVIKHVHQHQANGETEEVIDLGTCYCGWEEKLYDKTVATDDFETKIGEPGLTIIKEFIYPRKAFSVLFSGEKEWIAPLAVQKSAPENLSIAVNGYTDLGNGRGSFKLEITATILPEQKAITFYNAEALKEDFNTTLPVVKIELDDKIKLDIFLNNCEEVKTDCCDRQPERTRSKVSLYHFFRDVKILTGTKIDVSVCGLKNFIVQNDDSLQNVNAPIYPFGTRPDIIDFDVINPNKPVKNLIGPNFYVGATEVLGKAWNDISVNINWKDKPSDFRDYYKAYTAMPDPMNPGKFIYGLDEKQFQVNVALLNDGTWAHEQLHAKTVTSLDEGDQTQPNFTTGFFNRGMFQGKKVVSACSSIDAFDQKIHLSHSFFGTIDNKFHIDNTPVQPYKADTRNGFLRFNMQNQDFLHKDYAYVLARQMMAQSALPDKKFDIAVYYDSAGDPIVIDLTKIYNQIITAVANADTNATEVNAFDVIIPVDILEPAWSWDPTASEGRNIRDRMRGKNLPLLFNPPFIGVVPLSNSVKTLMDDVKLKTDPNVKLSAIIPNEPWTPIISNISIDYTATATEKDINLIHLYPYAGTYKAEELEQQPMLFPTFCDEGTFFIGIQNLVPGSNLNILFQLSEATADSEAEREALIWYYLENNEWKLLRTGFEVLNDDTDGLTTSGIIKFALPANMTNENSILPKGLHWIKAAIPCKSKSVSEIIGIHTQAIKASFTNDEANDKFRLAQPLEAGLVAKLKVADAAVKKIAQPYESFGGRVPEEEGHFYIRVSELLRHKNRAIQKFDYECLVLEAFPKIFKTKCINHTYALDASRYINDFPVAPGYVLIAVIPDLNQLKAAKSFEPKVPVSLLEQIETYLKKITSPFVRLKIMNPRYEKVNICIRVKLLPGKDEVYYKDKLGEDIRTFLAPWAIGEFEKLSFGQPVNKSNMIRFIESRDYIDYIIDLRMVHDDDNVDINGLAGNVQEIVPITARSILVAGSVDICIDQPGCETWCICNDAATNNNNQPCCDHPLISIHEEAEIIIT
jgi:hypothetical protein